MRNSRMRVFAAVAAGAALGFLGLAGASAPGVTARAAQVARVSAEGTSHGLLAVPGMRLWVRRYNGPFNGNDGADSAAVSPSGKTVYVTGSSARSKSGIDYATVAYSAATGARLWVERYHGSGNDNIAAAVAVSPGGGRVFVTGTSTGATTQEDYATVAYSAATGARLWVRRYNGPGNSLDSAASMAVSPSGKTVFVTGFSYGTTSDRDYATVAYSAATGAPLWARRYNGPANRTDLPSSVAVSHGGETVFVTGSSLRVRSGTDYATVAYNAATGVRLWAKRYNGPDNRFDNAASVAVSPVRGMVFVTGNSTGAKSGPDYATVAYNAATGARLWVQRYNGPGNGGDTAAQVAASPGGGRVFVTGTSFAVKSGPDYATIAYNAATGARLWVQRYNGPANSFESASSVAVSPTRGAVFVTGESTGAKSLGNFATVGYSAATGARLWVQRYNRPANSSGGAVSMAVSPTGGRVFVTGLSFVATTSTDYVTIAYSG